MASKSNTTKDHDEIRAWAEARGGKPAHVATTGSTGDIGILRIEFPGAPASDDSSLEEISWEQFFQKFDERGLSLLYQEETAGGEKSNFNKLVTSETASGAVKKRSRPSAAPRKATSKQVSPKKAVAKNPVAKKFIAKKAVAKKAVGKKSAPARKAPTKSSRPVVKKKAAKTAARRAVAKKTIPRSAAAKRPVKKTAARKRR